MSPLSLASPASANLQTPGLIATKIYNPTTAAYVGAPQASVGSDIDATNLAVTFVVPPSGQVLVKLTARVSTNSAVEHDWCLRESSSDVAGTAAIIHYNSSAYDGGRRSHSCIVTGLTPGTTKIYKWGQFKGAAGTAETGMGGTAGAAVMEVWDANPLFSQMAMLAIANVLTPSLIARKEWSNSSHYSTVSTTIVDVDATNLVVSFVAPPSGSVRILLSGFVDVGSTGVQLTWALRDVSGLVAGTGRTVTRCSEGSQVTSIINKTGLTPGTTYTYKWGWSTDNASFAARILQQITFPPAVMEVWDANVTYSQQLTISGVRPHKSFLRTAGNLTISSTTWADLPTIGTSWDVVLPAQIGDTIRVGVSVGYENQGNNGYMDAVTIVSLAYLNYFSTWSSTSAVEGIQAWQGIGSTYSGGGGSHCYDLVAGDIVGGLVRIRPIARSAGGKVIRANTNNPLHWWVENLGQAAA